MLFLFCFFGKTNKQMKKMNQPNVLTMSILVGTFYPHCDIKHTHIRTHTHTNELLVPLIKIELHLRDVLRLNI